MYWWSFHLVVYHIRFYIFFVFKQKTAYEMRISDWSSDVCSSDLIQRRAQFMAHVGEEGGLGAAGTFGGFALLDQLDLGFLQTGDINAAGDDALNGDRKSVV